jgi:hypothetical protein
MGGEAGANLRKNEKTKIRKYEKAPAPLAQRIKNAGRALPASNLVILPRRAESSQIYKGF